MVVVSPEAIFIGANRQTQVSSYNKGKNILAFGAGKNIALWNPLDQSSQGVFATLKGHEAEVTCVRFVPGSDLMVTASEDHHVKIWKFVSGNRLECIQTLSHYTHAIVALEVLPNLIVIGSAGGLVSIWTPESSGSENYTLAEEFSVHKNFFPLCFSLSCVVENKYILAIGGTSVNVFIYSFILSEGHKIENLKQAAVLEGHEDWVKSIAFRHQEVPGDYLLCTGSQDRYIRVWRVRINDLIDESEEDENKLTLLSSKQYKFFVDDSLKIGINFEALIMGHDDWVSSLQWHESKMQLLASTADTSLMVWEPDESSGVWVCALRLGEISSKGASTATGSSGGFWSCLWFNLDSKDYILTNGKTGSWRIWQAENEILCEQEVGITGAVKSVNDIAWAPCGQYLLSTSLDQTTRLYAPWRFDNNKQVRNEITWHEFSRPQIHGYDMICVEPISDVRFVSGGDEKIMRSFDLPRGVADLLNKFVGLDVGTSAEAMPEAASVPVLGLSNKATEEKDDEVEEDPDVRESNDNKNISYDLVSSLKTPPLEETLQRHLLWPEVEKLYGHGYEITSLDVSPDRTLIASACKSNTITHAVIRIFDINTWSEIKPPLSFHSLTITRLRFSHDSKYLLSVCRDRKWAVWERDFENNSFVLRYTDPKPHTRIIWDGDWAPLEFGVSFITTSRDRTIKFWDLQGTDEQAFKMLHSEKLNSPVTAISIYGKVVEDNLVVAAGLEDGSIFIYKYSKQDGFKLIAELDKYITPSDRIERLRWSSFVENKKFLLASASSDHSCRIFSVEL
ncbi:Elongator complex protein 2 [Nakaseomyces bracarensis]|uniref:Elongator complex protein 2 n=1 Tax=Nakaseomyces bracarensis TaxID=273131 RepID=A0ABR4NWJ7_9SACH